MKTSAMRAILKWVIGLGAVAVLGYVVAHVWFLRTYAQSDVQVHPYVAQMVDFVTTNGKEVVVERRTVSRRSDGSVHMGGVLYRPDGTEAASVRRVDLADGTVVGPIVDSVRAKATGHVSSDQLAAEKEFDENPPAQCALPGEQIDGEDTLFGFHAIRLSREAPGQDSVRYLFWRLPDFQCAQVQSFRQQRSSSDQQWATMVGLRLVSFVPASPTADLFTNWSGYQEMTPSDIKRAMAQKDGLTSETCPKCFAGDPSDQNYAKMHTQP